MIRVRIVLVLLAVVIIFVACTKGYNKNMSDGERTFRTYCQTCHILPDPATKTDSQWPALVQRYGARAKLSPRQVELIIQYVTDHN